jgi:hypothetical protein
MLGHAKPFMHQCLILICYYKKYAIMLFLLFIYNFAYCFDVQEKSFDLPNRLGMLYIEVSLLFIFHLSEITFSELQLIATQSRVSLVEWLAFMKDRLKKPN